MADTQKAISYSVEELDAAIPKAQNALQRTGGAMTGALTLAADPTEPMHAATRQFVLNNTPTGVVKSVNGETPDANGNVQIEFTGGSEYELPTASATVKGGVKVGEGLVMDGDVLGVKKCTWELIETCTLTEDGVFVRTNEPDGTPYALKALLVKMACTAAVGPASQGSRVEYNGQTLGSDWLQNFTGNTSIKHRFGMFFLENGYWFAEWIDWNNSVYYKNKGAQILAFSEEQYPYITKYATNASLVSGTTIEIWGVRA